MLTNNTHTIPFVPNDFVVYYLCDSTLQNIKQHSTIQVCEMEHLIVTVKTKKSAHRNWCTDLGASILITTVRKFKLNDRVTWNTK